jgi:hypothetical protein
MRAVRSGTKVEIYNTEVATEIAKRSKHYAVFEGNFQPADAPIEIVARKERCMAANKKLGSEKKDIETWIG